MADTAILARAGRSSVTAGNVENLRLDETRSLAVFGAHGKYHDAVLRGKCFSGATAVGGVAPGTSIATTAAFTLYNPLGSGFNLHVLRASMGYLSGTLGAGVIYYAANVNPAAAACTGTAITPTNNLLGGGRGVGQPLTTVTIPATPVVCRPFASLGASLASTAVQPWQIVEDVDSEFVITPGCALSLMGVTASGSSPLVIYGMTWEEFAISV